MIVAFGTDTVAGPDSFAEDRFLAEARALNQVLSNDDVVTSLTRNAAAYLGLDDELGTLEPGKIANWIAPPSKGINDNPFEFAFVEIQFK